jgi:hypothetical protein
LSIACAVLILITSMGIYGFLSAAYQKTAALDSTVNSQITLIETKRDNIKEQLAVYNGEKSSINESVTALRNGLSNNVIQYTDTLGNVITTTSSSTRRALEKQLDQAIDRQTEINSRVDDLNQKLFDYETEIVEVRSASEIGSELGPLKYLSGLTGLPMDKIINYLLLTIIFVFDPLAIALVIAANFAFEQLKPKTVSRETVMKELTPEEISRELDKNDKEKPTKGKTIFESRTKEWDMDKEEEYEYEYEPNLKDPKPLEVYGEKTELLDTIEKLETSKGKKSGFRQKKIQKEIDNLKSKLDSSDQITYF